jgi:hypothetical protein
MYNSTRVIVQFLLKQLAPSADDPQLHVPFRLLLSSFTRHVRKSGLGNIRGGETPVSPPRVRADPKPAA